MKRSGLCSMLLTMVFIMSLFPLFAIQAEAQAVHKSVGYVDSASGVTFVPVRYVADQLQAEVAWQGDTQSITITKDQTTVQLHVDNRTAVVDGETSQLAAAPFVEAGVTYVPLRLISEALGVEISWNEASRNVHLLYGDSSLKLPVITKGSKSQRKAYQSSKPTYRISQKTVTVNQVKVDLLDPRIRLSVGMAKDKIGNVESLQAIAERHGAKIAVNGTFFDAYSDAAFKQAYGHVVADGEVHSYGNEKRAVIWFDADNQTGIIPGDQLRELMTEAGVSGALQAGPTLVTNGEIILDPAGEGHGDPKILTGVGARSAVGLTDDHHLLIVTTSGLTIRQLAEVMQQAGAVQAMNLDGGASSGLYVNGKYVTTPGRLLSNTLLIHYEE